MSSHGGRFDKSKWSHGQGRSTAAKFPRARHSVGDRLFEFASRQSVSDGFGGHYGSSGDRLAGWKGLPSLLLGGIQSLVRSGCPIRADRAMWALAEPHIVELLLKNSVKLLTTRPVALRCTLRRGMFAVESRIQSEMMADSEVLAGYQRALSDGVDQANAVHQ